MTNGAPRRVYLVSWWFAAFGGQERHITELACALRRRGVDVRVFSETPVGKDNQYRRRLEAARIPFWAPPLPGWLVQRARNAGLGNPLSAMGKGTATATNVAMGTGLLSRWLRGRLDREVRQAAPDLVHVHGFRLGQAWVVAWAAERGLRCLYTEHSTLGDWDGPTRSDAPQYLGTASGIACVSERSAADLRMLLPEKTVEIHPHVLPPTPPKRHGAAGIPRILAVSRLRAEKGLDILLEAAALLLRRCGSFQLRVAGDGPDRAALDQLCVGLGLSEHVVFAGGLQPEQLDPEWQAADIFVLPSRTEAMPVSLLEAMSRGLAIVATRVGGVPELINDNVTGLLVPPESPKALADALAALLETPDFRRQLGLAARTAFDNSRYCEEVAMSAVLESYARALA